MEPCFFFNYSFFSAHSKCYLSSLVPWREIHFYFLHHGFRHFIAWICGIGVKYSSMSWSGMGINHTHMTGLPPEETNLPNFTSFKCRNIFVIRQIFHCLEMMSFDVLEHPSNLFIITLLNIRINLPITTGLCLEQRGRKWFIFSPLLKVNERSIPMDWEFIKQLKCQIGSHRSIKCR